MGGDMAWTTGRPRPPIMLAMLLFNLVAQVVFGLLAMTICLPSMQEWGQIFGRDQAAVQLTLSAFLVPYGGMQLVFGPLSDRYGRRPLLLAGLALALLGSLLAATASDLNTLIAARALLGAGCAAGMVIGRASVQDVFQGPARTRAMAYIGMSLGMTPPTATVLGGYVHVHLGWAWNFVLLAVLTVVLMAMAWRGLNLPPQAPSNDRHWLINMGAAYRRLLREASFQRFVVIFAATSSTFYAFMAATPVVLGHYGVGPDGVGWYVMVVPLGYMVGNYATSHWAHRYGDMRMMLLGHALTLLGIVSMLLCIALGWATALSFAAPLVLVGVGHGLLMPPTLGATVGVVPALAGTAAAFAGLMQQVAGAGSGYLMGVVPHDNAANVGWAMLVFTAISSLFLLWQRQRSRPPGPQAVL